MFGTPQFTKLFFFQTRLSKINFKILINYSYLFSPFLPKRPIGNLRKDRYTRDRPTRDLRLKLDQ